MVHGGLCSVTFRNLPARDVARLAKQAGLACIEWGGDAHVPPGGMRQAREARALTEDAGLRVASYGSYYRVIPSADPAPFETIVETAIALGAPLIRVWAGKVGSAEADAAYREQAAAESRRIAALAEAAGIAVAFEYHGGTLTDRVDSAIALLRDTAHSNMGVYWQPRPEMDVEENLAVLTMLKPWLRALHVLHWQPDPKDAQSFLRRPLDEGRADWQRYLAEAGGDRDALLEFVANDDENAFLADAAALLAMLRPAGSQQTG